MSRVNLTPRRVPQGAVQLAVQHVERRAQGPEDLRNLLDMLGLDTERGNGCSGCGGPRPEGYKTCLPCSDPRECMACGKEFQGRHRKCPVCRVKPRECAGCGRQFSDTTSKCWKCRATRRTCVGCNRVFSGTQSECGSCRVLAARPPRIPRQAGPPKWTAVLDAASDGAILRVVAQRVGLAEGYCGDLLTQAYKVLGVTGVPKMERRREAVEAARRAGLIPGG